jgi:hypothetical protein
MMTGITSREAQYSQICRLPTSKAKPAPLSQDLGLKQATAVCARKSFPSAPGQARRGQPPTVWDIVRDEQNPAGDSG